MELPCGAIPGSKPDGTPILSVIGKQTFAIAMGAVGEAEQQVPMCTEDTFVDPNSPMYSEVADETDLIFYKPSTDVIIKGAACAPKGKQAYHLDCEAQVGPCRKTVRVWGNRKVESKALRGLTISDPEPFAQLSLGYTQAYGGGAQDKAGTLYAFYPNPIGKGFAIRGGFEDPEELRVPNLEDPLSPVSPDNLVLSKFEEWPHAPKPASLGWTRRNFYPRYTYAGVLPEYLEAAQQSVEWAKKRDPRFGNMTIPKMDYRVYQGASEGLWEQQLAGGEHVSLAYMDPEHPRFEFDLPVTKPTITLDLGKGPVELEPILQTVVIDKNENRLCMVWRGSMVYGGVHELAEVSDFRPRVWTEE